AVALPRDAASEDSPGRKLWVHSQPQSDLKGRQIQPCRPFRAFCPWPRIDPALTRWATVLRRFAALSNTPSSPGLHSAGRLAAKNQKLNLRPSSICRAGRAVLLARPKKGEVIVPT